MNLFSALFLKTLLSAVYRIKTRLFRPKSEATAQSFSYLRFIESPKIDRFRRYRENILSEFIPEQNVAIRRIAALF